jgi:arachidonate 15-lipoxygenase
MNTELRVPTTEDRPASGRRAYDERYKFRAAHDNQLHPICVAKKWPWLREQYTPRWGICFAFNGYLFAYLNRYINLLGFLLQYLILRFDKVKAYRQLFVGPLPEYVDGADRDDHFAWRRIAGPNALSIRQEKDLAAVLRKIPDFDVERVEQRLKRRVKDRPISLEQFARDGRLFVCDYEALQRAVRPKKNRQLRGHLSHKAIKHLRDSRWRQKYLPAPIGVFLELPGFYKGIDLVPLAIQIDQLQRRKEPVYYPDDARSWGWRLAKLYFEVADENYHVGRGHVVRTHLAVNPFCMATPRHLPRNHPVYRLLRPHTRFTLAANKAVYKYYIKRKRTYADFYGGKLEEYRRFSVQSHKDKSFFELTLLAELKSRGVLGSPVVYPYRDDAFLWLAPIRDFVAEYLDAHYADDAAVTNNKWLRAWAEELADPCRGGVRGLDPEDCLSSKEKLGDLLAQVIFIAGPGHASQHFSEMYYYRYPPACVGSAYAPPPRWAHEANGDRWLQTLPGIRQAARQFCYSTFGDFQYDTFGHYRWYPLGWKRKAREPIRKLQDALKSVEEEISCRAKKRPLRYDFLLPSRVPNSINI